VSFSGWALNRTDDFLRRQPRQQQLDSAPNIIFKHLELWAGRLLVLCCDVGRQGHYLVAFVHKSDARPVICSHICCYLRYGTIVDEVKVHAEAVLLLWYRMQKIRPPLRVDCRVMHPWRRVLECIVLVVMDYYMLCVKLLASEAIRFTCGLICFFEITTTPLCSAHATGVCLHTLRAHTKGSHLWPVVKLV